MHELEERCKISQAKYIEKEHEESDRYPCIGIFYTGDSQSRTSETKIEWEALKPRRAKNNIHGVIVGNHGATRHR